MRAPRAPWERPAYGGAGWGSAPRRTEGGLRECGEVAERSKALDWNSSNIFTGVRGFESHPLRQF